VVFAVDEKTAIQADDQVEQVVTRTLEPRLAAPLIGASATTADDIRASIARFAHRTADVAAKCFVSRTTETGH